MSMTKKRRNDAIQADKELQDVLKFLLSEDIKITVRECVRRMNLINHPSSITRSKWRSQLVQNYINKQLDLHLLTTKIIKRSRRQLESQIITLKQQLEESKTREHNLSLAVSALMISALSQGVNLEEFYLKYSKQLSRNLQL